jgi:ATP-dependent Clp protease adaptor protein ClpS
MSVPLWEGVIVRLAAAGRPTAGAWGGLAPLRIIPSMARKHETERDHGAMVETSKPETARPPLYSVLLLNDDYTPMDFVVDVLMRFFSMNLEKATQVMLHVHTRGRGVCGVFTRDVAESKVAQVNEYARVNQHPLLCTMEKA